jgi:probable F420-dependent oxidoreductase
MNQFGRYGVWVSSRLWPRSAAEVASAAQELESLGFGSVWIGGSPADDLALPEAILAATSELVVGTSIVDIWRSDPTSLSASHVRIRAQFPGRFYLGVGSGHAPAAEATGQQYVKPLSRLRGYVDSLSGVPQDELMLAALGPKALEASRDISAGALPYLTPPAHTADARAILGTDRLLIPEQKVLLNTDATQAREVGRRGAANYLVLPNYLNNLRRYGFTDEDFADGGTDRLIDTVLVWGDEEAVRKGVNAHLEAGADHVAVQALSTSTDQKLPRAEWQALAGALLN